MRQNVTAVLKLLPEDRQLLVDLPSILGTDTRAEAFRELLPYIEATTVRRQALKLSIPNEVHATLKRMAKEQDTSVVALILCAARAARDKLNVP